MLPSAISNGKKNSCGGIALLSDGKVIIVSVLPAGRAVAILQQAAITVSCTSALTLFMPSAPSSVFLPQIFFLTFGDCTMGILKSIRTSPLTDAELLNLYRQSLQQETLAQLFLRYNELVYGTCIKYLGDQDAAKDATMNIYHELVEKVKLHEIEHFKSWLYVVTKNHCLMQIRKNKKLAMTEFDGQVMQSEDFSHLENVFEKERQLDKLGGCMQKLNDEQRQTVRLFYLENKCYNEITAITGFEWNRVRSLVQNGRRNLKICMEDNG